MNTARRGFLVSLLASGAALAASTPTEANPSNADDVVDGGTP
jgi:hypothetical protein